MNSPWSLSVCYSLVSGFPLSGMLITLANDTILTPLPRRSVLAQLYYFKPQTLLVSENFLLIVIYFIGKGWEKALPSRGLFRYINPGPFNIKEHGNYQSLLASNMELT